MKSNEQGWTTSETQRTGRCDGHPRVGICCWVAAQQLSIRAALTPVSQGRRAYPLRPSAAKARGVADPHGRTEVLLGPRVERAEDPVQLVVVDPVVGDLAGEEDGGLVADSERAPEQPEVASQQVLVERSLVLLGPRHHVGLVLQRALAQVEPDREHVLLLPPHAHEPPAFARLLVALDGRHHGVLVALPVEPRLDASTERIELVAGGRPLGHPPEATASVRRAGRATPRTPGGRGR